MKLTLSPSWQMRLMNASFVLLFLVVMGLLQWLAREYRLQFDLTQNGRHSLSEASLAVLKQLDQPLTITAYASQRGELRRAIGEFIARYQHHKSDLKLEFVDPDISPEQVRTAGVQFDGELVLQYGAVKENLPPNRLTEENFSNVLTRLGHSGERWLIFLSGHGERSPDRAANFDVSLWATELRKRGFKTRTLALGDHPQIPQNTTALVIAGPRTRLLPGETREIGNYLNHGGNLLWLQDPGPLYGLEPIAEQFGIEFLPGVIVDPASDAITGSATAILVAKYGAHPVVRSFAEATLFPHARAIALPAADKSWQSQVLLDTRASSWAETGALTGNVRFDPGQDIKGPLNLGVTLTREIDAAADGKHQQRIVVLGDGDFLSNTYLGNAGNLEFGLSLTNWLSQDDAFVNIPVRTRTDKTLRLSQTSQVLLVVGFLILLPLLLAGSGVTIWLKRRKR